jgi:predicted metal-binding protein
VIEQHFVVDHRSLVPKKAPFERRVLERCLAQAIMAGHDRSSHPAMTQDRALKLVSAIKTTEKTAPFRQRLTPEQFECLSRCAKGISVRFERHELIDALLAGGYVERGVAGIISVTARGQGYLRTHSG